MRTKHFFLNILFLILGVNLSGQIHWASKVTGYSSEYSPDRNSAQEILGLPNVDPQGRPSPFAWAVAPNELDKEGVEWAYIDVEFDSTYLTQQIAIFQSLNPGAISLVFVNPVRHSSGDSVLWKLVYANKDVIIRTGLPKFVTVPDSLYSIAGTKTRRVFPPDRRFKPDKKYDILRIFLDQPMPVRQVRIVINTLAIDGWNQIDAVGISSSMRPIKYPRPRLANQGMILQAKPTKVLSTKKTEISPVVYPDGKFLFFTRTEKDKGLGIETQDIYMAEMKEILEHPCARSIKHQTYKDQTWANIAPIPWNFNSPLPNAVVGFSANGRYMFLSGYTGKDKKDLSLEQLVNQSSQMLSVSRLDSIYYTQADSNIIAKIDTNLRHLFKQIYISPEKNIILGTRTDTIDSIIAIYYKVLHNKKWTDPQLIGYARGKKLFTIIKTDQGQKTLWIQVDSIAPLEVKFTQLVWSRPEKINIQGFVNYSNYISFFVSPENKVMFLALDDSNTVGERDLFISFYDDSTHTWSRPENLGLPINTLADESSPYLDGDGKTLFFASAGHEGYGGYDQYVTYRLDNTWKRWSEPQNLGPIINTPADELNMSIHQTTREAYYISTGDIKSCRIQSDIYSIKLAKPVILHIKGRTLCCQSEIGLGDVNVALVSVQNGKIIGDRIVRFKSDFNGNFDVKISRLIDASRLGQFGLIAWRDTLHLCDSTGKKIKYFPVNLTNPDWNIDITAYLHLTARCTPPVVTVEPQQPEEKPQKPVDTTYVPQKQVTVYGQMKVDTIGCPVIYHRGVLYAMTSVSAEHPNPFIELDPVYVKYFDYNQSDISINENTFQYLLTQLEANLKRFKTVNVYIVASASKVPTQAYCSNFELARMRAQNLEDRISKYLKEHGIPEHRVFFDKRYVVEGPEYQLDPENIKRYKPYQYVKAWIYSCSNEIGK